VEPLCAEEKGRRWSRSRTRRGARHRCVGLRGAQRVLEDVRERRAAAHAQTIGNRRVSMNEAVVVCVVAERSATARVCAPSPRADEEN
jgi:predicted transcriptional regulator